MATVSTGSMRTIERDNPEFYPTPYWATEALLVCETFPGPIWEPACGDGAMSKVLVRLTNQSVISTDKHDRGYGRGGIDALDFTLEHPFARSIITNPPFSLAEEFIHMALLKPGVDKFAFLLRLAFLEGRRRCDEIFGHFPPSRVWVFSERLSMYPAGHVSGGTSAICFAWFVWEKPNTGQTRLGWINGFK